MSPAPGKGERSVGGFHISILPLLGPRGVVRPSPDYIKDVSCDKNPLLQRRGGLGEFEPGARGLEHMARNPQCKRLAVLTLAATSPAEVSGKVYGRPVSEGLSPFAIRRGERFEAALIEDGGKRLFGMYQEHGRLSRAECLLQDMSKTHPGTKPQELQARLEASRDLVRDRASGVPGLPNIVIKPRLVITVLGREYPCEPDALVASDSDLTWRVVEMKSYADRWARTSTAKTGSACRQAAVGLLALEEATGARFLKPTVDLIFARPATNWPTLNSMEIESEAESLRQALAEAGSLALEASDLMGDFDLDTRQGLEGIPTNPCSGCADHCALWEECRGRVIAEGSPALLGDSAAELLAGFTSLDQVLEARNKGGGDDTDRDLLAALLSDCEAQYQEALG